MTLTLPVSTMHSTSAQEHYHPRHLFPRDGSSSSQEKESEPEAVHQTSDEVWLLAVGGSNKCSNPSGRGSI